MSSLLSSLSLDATLTMEMLERAAQPIEVLIPDAMMAQVERGHAFVQKILAEGGQPVYGATTGFGPLVDFHGRTAQEDQCDNALQHLTAGQGPDLPLPVVRAAMLIRLRSLSCGLSGISPAAIEALRAALATAFTPAVPTLGSVGASGDLVPLAYVAQSLRGVGDAYVGGERMPAARALAAVGLSSLVFTGRDALSLVNGTSVTSAAGGLAVASLQRSHEVAIALSALLTDLLGAAPAFLLPPLLAAYGHPAVRQVGQGLTSWLEGSVPSGTRSLQEPYSVRCVPQLLGAARSAVDWAGQVVQYDLEGVSDNPLFFADEDLVAHGGNFFGQPTAFAADLLSMVATQLGNLAERQLDLLVDPHRNAGLPPMLTPLAGEHHGVQGVQLAATATVVSMRRHCVPASTQSVPTNLHNQDVIPFGTQAALTALHQAKSLRILHGSLAVALRQAAYLKPGGASAPRCAELVAALADLVTPIAEDRPLDADVRAAADVLDRVVREA
ncbi:aromatic amino acid ammonia-lyase [Streptomyces sp. PTM05]|uniref:Aromatic amino acid ammonia-lyase n=1 Tax=Streptantibioticus parmotrematis TaxID=2873249 RepID=A0ABS7QXD8_9ACTN|nr:aromatic amino acid ammonia-lyase [Streptantibioticus parmotrematis]MBY8887025.1 aromatic amino acid ammonia-lyase [Streptantibioticus parmotrematis]